jgi:hypothetical protein
MDTFLQSMAVLVMLSLGQYVRVVEMLYEMRQFSKAACFVQACMEFGLMEKSVDTGKYRRVVCPYIPL